MKKERREHLERLLDEIGTQQKYEADEVLTEMISIILELDDELNRLRGASSEEHGSSGVQG